MLSMTACGKNSTASGKEEDGKLKVVTTIFPYYDFVRQIAGDKVSLSMAVPAGMDTHSFEPTAADMIEIGKADILIYNGFPTTWFYHTNRTTFFRWHYICTDISKSHATATKAVSTPRKNTSP